MKTKTFSPALILGLLVFPIVASSQQPVTHKVSVSQSAVPVTTTLHGKITRKDTGLTIVTVGVRPITVNVSINAKTTFSLNGVLANFVGIKVGDSVVVKYIPLGQPVDAISVEAHRHRLGSVDAVLDPLTPQAAYPYCPNVGSGGTIESKNIPCYCNACGGAGSGMVW
ncbi:MAG TPA: hypothetical protein VGQ46_09005 [Thermoanaerobaculia bacterium]|jgi:hypothetical protein|nr:hypothetical protein [Thermoanaerobaculia bacterium]